MPNEPVKLIECPRDAWQGLKRKIPTKLKVDYLRALIDAGFRHLDAVSFVSPKAVPQMADSEQVLAQLGPPGDIEIIGIVVNEKGAERAIATGAVSTLGYPCSVSETFLRKNQNQSLDENYEALKAIKKQANAARRELVVYISMAFGNPYGDSWNEDQLKCAVHRVLDLGLPSISLADTVGLARPELIQRVVSSAVATAAGCEVGVHMHSTPADAVEKVLAAYDAGCRRFDSAIGGLGGCPFAQDTLVGNIPTESVIEALRSRRVELPIAKSLGAAVALSGRIGTQFS